MAKPIKFIVADFETDPFEYAKRPNVFLAGICDGTQTVQWWGENAVASFCEYLSQLREKHYIFFHNGGKFDFFFLPWPLGDPLRIINGRIVSAKLGRHTLRDSFAILPFSLSTYKKTEINYDKFKKDVRETHRDEILSYHRDDLASTYELVAAFLNRFGLRLTAPSAAIRELNKHHPVERKGESHDAKFRQFYFGGRVECFERGTLHGNWKLYDVNSMYPTVMAGYAHPIGREYEFTTSTDRLIQDKRPGFAIVDADSNGAFPSRQNETLTFPNNREEFHVTLYELREAVRLNLLTIHSIREGYISRENGNFNEFVQMFSAEKIAAKQTKNKIGELFAKLILNSAYGKFGANPENYYDYKFLKSDDPFPRGWEIYEDYGWLIIARRQSPIRAASYYDVATAASITGAARAILLRAIHSAKRPIYCDTDSIICESLDAEMGDGLGQWKLECEASEAIILEKKLYALHKNNELIKSAHKGIELELKDYIAISKGIAYNYKRDAPTFKRDGSATFITRRIQTQ